MAEAGSDKDLRLAVLIDADNNIAAKGLWGADLRQAISDLAKKNRKSQKSNN